MNKRLRYLALGFTTVLLILCVGCFSGQGFHWSLPLAQAKTDALSTQSGEDGARLLQAGRDRYQQGQYEAAGKLWQEAATVFAAQGDRLKQAMVLSNLALADQQLGQWSEANQAIESSLQLLGASGRGSQPGSQSERLRVQAQVWNNQGGLQLAQGQAEQA